MGTINYKTSDFITIGYNCNNIDYDDQFYYEYIQEEYDAIQDKLKNNNFYYFHVVLEPGYYEGFTIDIEYNFPICIDTYEDKKAAYKEITQIKQFLIYCVENYNCVACFPGWCMGYADYRKTLSEISNAVYNMRDTVKNTPTDRQYCKELAYFK
jgi:hypothetical protein